MIRLRNSFYLTKSNLLSRKCCTFPVRVRFAPSPTGELHLGGLRTALYNYLFAQSRNGSFILRIEDTDQTRKVIGATEKMIHMLQWCGIEIDEGPSVGGDYGSYYQSERLPIYRKHIDTLLHNDTAYRCFCSPKRLDLLRKDCLRRGQNPKYDNRCRNLSEDDIHSKVSSNIPYTVRLKLKPFLEPWNDAIYGPITNDISKVEGDPILMKSDGYPTYHFANVVDDHLMKITHVLRGEEWQVSTPKHFMLYDAFKWKPPVFAHLPLILNSDGSKLSKRQNDIHVEYFKKSGYFPETVIKLLTTVGSGFDDLQENSFLMSDLVKKFDIHRIKTNSSKLDMDKLPLFNRSILKNNINSQDIKLKNQLIADVRYLVGNLLEEKGSFDVNLNENVLSDVYIWKILQWSQHRVATLNDLVGSNLQFLWILPSHELLNLYLQKHKFKNPSYMLDKVIEELYLLKNSSSLQEDLSKKLKDIAKINHWKYGSYMQLLRNCISGLKDGPGVAEMVDTLGIDNSIIRMKLAAKYMKSK